MAFGILGAIVAIALDAAIAYLRKDWADPVGIVLVAGVAAFSGVIPLLRRDRPTPSTVSPPPPAQPWGAQPVPPPYGAQPAPPAYGAQPPPPPYSPPPGVPARPAGTRVPMVVAVLVMLLLCGGGVGAVTFGARYIGGWVTGDEAGFDVLAEERSAEAGDVTLTVHQVLLTRHYTRVELSATNRGSNTINLPIFGNCQLIPSGDRRTLDGDPFRSDWSDAVPPGQTVRGIVTFPRLPDGVDSISISFATIFGQFGATSITIADVPLT
jgi:hypothetical protein